MEYISPEQLELKKRWPNIIRELTHLVNRIKDIKGPNENKLPPELSSIEKKSIIDSLCDSILTDDKPELKRSVVRRMANKIGNYIIWRREPSIPVIHELMVLLPWWFAHMPLEVITKLRDIGLENILNGQIMPVQTVWKDILNAKKVYLGHCVCRSSGIVSDLYKDDEFFTIASKQQNIYLLNRIMNRYRSLIKIHGHLPDTDSKFEKIFQKMAYYRKNHFPQYCLEFLLEQTFPNWEIIPVLDKFTQSWIHSMHTNHKAFIINKELAFEFATLHYLSRGSIFTSMKLFDTPYTICTCPSPESDGGCILTNWYYYGNSETSILPNEQEFGRRKDESGNVLNCNIFSQRKHRKCIGCGCNHKEDNQRDFDMIIKQANRVLQSYRKKIKSQNKEINTNE